MSQPDYIPDPKNIHQIKEGSTLDEMELAAVHIFMAGMNAMLSDKRSHFKVALETYARILCDTAPTFEHGMETIEMTAKLLKTALKDNWPLVVEHRNAQELAKREKEGAKPS